MRLSRDVVLAGALRLLDETGLDQLSMRRLAAVLGVQNGATYWHFHTKAELLEAMADDVLGDVLTGFDAEGVWHERLAELMRRFRTALLARRDGARLFSGLFSAGPHALSFGETMVGLMRAGGLSARQAIWSGDTLIYYVVGHTVEEQAALALPGGGDDKVRELAAALDPARYPNTAAALADIPAPHPEEHFEYGLALILTGLRTP
ncbi:TetR/AcrR family transcriptional regulator [Amycolatopsis sp. H20-H5]|uniref:TetR/AcrR family transcriptional regulator n=1 Tax=Amycolatopsis sp. H20-H5 TaxID=3046309 RepID=UPI002DBBA8E2|nr:TetR/AcrR family transcriptional regulator [Amycolatopsis sp. H20-H5]MEC3978603.1 TetR/AcrR family transcriptional regulator [Amycolatopsis sp. H20-H5]